MKRIFFVLAVVLLSSASYAQKFAYIDTDYVLKNIPAYESANDQVNQLAATWQKELEGMYKEIETLYKTYQTESVFLSNELKIQRENEIVEKEKKAKALQDKYFGKEGDLFKKRQALIKPIQDEIYNTLQEMIKEDGYSIIFDKSGGMGILAVDPKYDKSDEVLKKLGYKN